ncbi:MAG: 2,5-diamino-6-(ribosylamino)-4(3H)-pyrimidinone 5'-phosphate reductase [Desulfurococcales archaeon]|nr:2,5-diamino-6-(ribosylamino)-4(3H)-pyrimidinone 5'-phosphate reductase [Desulfurococcales archaeon]
MSAGNLGAAAVRERPYVIIYVTSSVDGKIASISGDSRLSCMYDLRRLHSLRASCDAVMVGANTVIRDDPLLTVRYVEGRNPLRVVIDGSLRIPTTSRIITDKSAKTLIVTSASAPASKVAEFIRLGVEVVCLPAVGGSKVNLAEALRILWRRGVKRLLVEGGGNLIWNLVSEGLIDEFRITLSPYIVGGARAVTPVEGEGFASKDAWLRLKLVNYMICECGNEIHAIYVPIK